MDELDIVSNQNLSVEMFLFRLMRIKGFKEKDVEESFIGKHPDTLIQETEKKIGIKYLENFFEKSENIIGNAKNENKENL